MKRLLIGVVMVLASSLWSLPSTAQQLVVKPLAEKKVTELPAGPDRTPVLMSAILRKRLTLRGFIQTEFVAELMGEFLERATGWVRDGSLRYKEHVVDGLENAPDAFIGMLDGKNFGKLLVRVS